MPAAAALLADAAALGKLKPRPSKSISGSHFSIGFETLDRQMFDPERTYGHLAQLGVKWARCQTGWARTEKIKGEYDFAWLDTVVDSLLKIGIQPWFNLGYGNRLYTPLAPHESAVGWAPLNSPEAKEAWLKYVDNITAHYRDRVQAWEIWNEPQGPGFWQPGKGNADDYVGLVKMTAPVIRRNVPRSTIIGGVVTGFPTVLVYLERCMEAGMGDFVDKVSFHPYRARPEENYAADVRAMRGIMSRYKPGMPLWQGENGAPSVGHGTGALSDMEWTEATQAKWLLRRLLSDLSQDIEVTSYFHTVDLANYVWTSGQSGQTNPKGVLRSSDYTPKPSYYAFQNLCALFDDDTKRADYLMRFDRGAPIFEEASIQSASFIRKGRPIYVYWYPSDLQKDYAARQVRACVWSGNAAKLENPVIVDLMSGQITQPNKPSQSGGLWYFEASALRDYPVLITDSALVS